MFSHISYPRRGMALALYLVAVAVLGTAIVSAHIPRTAILVGIGLALLFAADLFSLRVKNPEPSEPRRTVLDLSAVEVDGLLDRVREAVREVDREPAHALPDEYVVVMLSFECEDADTASEIVADLNNGDPNGLQRVGYAVDRATYRGAELDWQGWA